MRRSLTGADLFAELMMTRQLDRRLLLLVESEEDCSVIDPHLNDPHVHSIPGFGKNSVVEAMKLVADASVEGVLGLVDADFDALSGAVASYPPGIVLTEYYDLDADVLFLDPEAIRALAISYSKRDARKAYLEQVGKSIFDIIVEAASSVGALRLRTLSEGLGFSLQRFPMKCAVDGVESGRLFEEVLEMATLRSIDASVGSLAPDDLARDVTSSPDRRKLCRGHDILAALSVLVRKWDSKAGHKELECAARARVSCSTWSKTVFFRQVAEWATSLGRQAWTCQLVDLQ